MKSKLLQNLKILSVDMMLQVEESTSDFMWWVTPKTQAQKKYKKLLSGYVYKIYMKHKYL